MSDLTPGTWTIDPAHSEVSFTIRHVGLFKVRGRFNTFSGTIDVADDLLASSVRATIDMASVDTNNADRDAHLRSTDIFDVGSHPEMTFRSTGVTPTGDGYAVTGDLTLNGHTRAVELALEHHGVAVDAFGFTRAGFSATTELSRRDYGIEFNIPLEAGGVLLGDKVTVELEIQATAA